MASVRLDNLCKNFGAVRAVDGVSLEIPDGELMVLVVSTGSLPIPLILPQRMAKFLTGEKNLE